jgi:hypothetical protein
MANARPKHLLTASGKLLDASNSAAPTLSAHKHAIEAKRASDDAAITKRHQASDKPIPTSTPSSPPLTATQEICSDSDQDSQQPCKSFNRTNPKLIDVDLQQVGKNYKSR